MRFFEGRNCVAFAVFCALLRRCGFESNCGCDGLQQTVALGAREPASRWFELKREFEFKFEFKFEHDADVTLSATAILGRQDGLLRTPVVTTTL